MAGVCKELQTAPCLVSPVYPRCWLHSSLPARLRRDQAYRGLDTRTFYHNICWEGFREGDSTTYFNQLTHPSILVLSGCHEIFNISCEISLASAISICYWSMIEEPLSVIEMTSNIHTIQPGLHLFLKTFTPSKYIGATFIACRIGCWYVRRH